MLQQNVTATISNSTDNNSVSEEATAAASVSSISTAQDYYYSHLNSPSFLQHQISCVSDSPIINTCSRSSSISLQGEQQWDNNKRPKKKRNLPGNPDPDAEIIALSPTSLLTTPRFICEVCNKGFQRDQNLQLHRRGHNLPWKLKQKTTNNKSQSEEQPPMMIRRKAYVCPEPSCVHHDPTRALGDLTGIKKHYSRKHGEKKWKCEKCGKGYAVKSDWKVHVKGCGTREYRCDCGTVFSRKDSFITHRAFCDALAEESARLISEATASSNPFNITTTTTNPPPAPTFYNQNHNQPLPPPPQQQSFTNTAQWRHQSFHHQNPNYIHTSSSSNIDHHQNLNSSSTSAHHPYPHLSATALLQKACTMGVAIPPPGLSSHSQSHVEGYQSSTNQNNNDDENSQIIWSHNLDQKFFNNGPVIDHVVTSHDHNTVVHNHDVRPPQSSSSLDDQRRQYLLKGLMRSTPPRLSSTWNTRKTDHLTRDFLGLTDDQLVQHHYSSSGTTVEERSIRRGGADDSLNNIIVPEHDVLRYTDGSLDDGDQPSASTNRCNSTNERQC